YNVSKVVITWEAAYATSYDLLVSVDNITWTTYYSGTNSFPTNSGGTSTVPTPSGVTATGRYVKIIGKQRAIVWGGQWGYSFFEFQVFGTAASTPSAPATVTNPIPSD